MPESVLHHIGFATDSIEDAINRFAHSLGATIVTEVIHDPLQNALVAFVKPASRDAVQIELIAPTSGLSPLSAFVQRGGGLHHLCYEVDDIEAQLRDSRARKSVVIRKPKPAIAFAGRRVAWVVTPERLVIEYLSGRKSLEMHHPFLGRLPATIP